VSLDLDGGHEGEGRGRREMRMPEKSRDGLTNQRMTRFFSLKSGFVELEDRRELL
jgi:hypothetical protein